MSVEMVINLDHLKSRVKQLKSIDKALIVAGETAIASIKCNWLGGKGGDGRKLSPLSPKYREWKQKKYGRGKADMYLSGDMARSFHALPVNKSSVKLTFTGDAMGKAKNNYKLRNNILEISDKIKSKVVTTFLKWITK